ncbi:unnamed protein product [Rhizophagus irregularis]|nr:unnamed protein product [Rhizophagus irregularis]CAB5179535.1 unnamed protein product [Rhizophagus irregularis]
METNRLFSGRLLYGRILKVPGCRFNISKVRWLFGYTGIQYFEGSAVLVWNLTFQSFHWLLLRHWTFDT